MRGKFPQAISYGSPQAVALAKDTPPVWDCMHEAVLPSM